MELSFEYSKTYATRDNAMKAAERIIGWCKCSQSRVIIGTTPAGRFSPVFLVRGEDITLAGGIARHGFNVLG